MLVVGVFTNGGLESAVALLTIILGGIGLWGLLQLSIKSIDPTTEVTAPQRLLAFISSGIIALIIGAFLLGGIGIIFILPLLVTVHFCYLNKWYLWPQS